MNPFRNVLFPTDFSQRSRGALKYAAAFAREGAGEVVLINVQDTKVPPDMFTLPREMLAEEHRRIRSEVEKLLASSALRGVNVDPKIVDGDTATSIARAAIDHEVDLITVVAHAKRSLTRALGGSLAEEIIAEAPCPVLAIRPQQKDFVEVHNDDAKIRLKRILLATNFRPSSAAATQVATQLAHHQGAELHVIYVIGDYFEQIAAIFPEGGLAALTRLRSNVQERMSRMAKIRSSQTSTHIAEGRPYEEIVKHSVAVESDLIVIGSASHNSLFGGSKVLGSEVERVIRSAPCPVLCVPAFKVLTPLPAFVTQPA